MIVLQECMKAVNEKCRPGRLIFEFCIHFDTRSL